MKFKRKKPKSARAGYLLCKPHKIMGNGMGAKTLQTLKALESFKQQINTI